MSNTEGSLPDLVVFLKKESHQIRYGELKREAYQFTLVPVRPKYLFQACCKIRCNQNFSGQGLQPVDIDQVN